MTIRILYVSSFFKFLLKYAQSWKTEAEKQIPQALGNTHSLP